MTPVSITDLALLIPELILVGMALALLLGASRIQTATLATAGTVLAALAAALTAGWLMLAGVAVNAAMVPVHAWLSDAYPEASVTGMVFAIKNTFENHDAIEHTGCFRKTIDE